MLRLSLLVLLLCSACRFDASVPDDVRPTCDAGVQCPPGHQCRPSISRCVPTAHLGLEPPKLLASGVLPATGNPDARFVVTLTTDRALFAPPVVTAWALPPRRVAPFRLLAGSETTFIYELQPSTDAPGTRDATLQVFADLIDPDGTTATGLLAGTFTVDGSPPQVVPSSVALRLVPGPDNPLSSVTALGPGTTAVLGFQVDEPLVSPPELEAGPLRFDAGTGTTSWEAWGTLDANVPAVDARVPLRVTLEDRYGNRAVRDLGVAVPVDATPPEEPGSTAVVRRVPWGLADGGPPRLSVRAPAATFEPSSTVIVYPYGQRVELGRGQADLQGELWPPLMLAVADQAKVEVRAVDAAGNVSSPALVRDVEWVATLNGKVPGRSLENPHRTFARAFNGPMLDQPDQLETYAPDAGSDVDFELSWQRHTLFSPNDDVAGAFDLRRHRYVTFGGQRGAGFNDETWEWDGTTWRRLTPLAAPQPRASAAMAYDLARGRTVLHGGAASFVQLDTWEWDGQRWFLRSAGGPLDPPARVDHAMAYDPLRRRVVMFGGYRGAVLRNDTWEWDGTRWQEVTTGTAPPGRSHHAMVYQPDLQAIVLHGGRDGGPTGALLADTWAYRDGRWSPLPAGPPLSGHSLVWDPVHHEVLAVGGSGSSSQLAVFDGGAWGARPTDLVLRAGVAWYDPARAQVIAHGVTDAGLNRYPTFALAGATWEPLVVPPAGPGDEPAGRFGHVAGMGPDGGLILFGGQLDLAGTLSGETWEWNGRRWRPVTGGGPAARVDAAAAQAGSRFWVFGGVTPSGAVSNELWSYGPGGWQLDSTPGRPARRRTAMFFDSGRGTPVIAGGNAGAGALAETWALVPPARWDAGDEAVQGAGAAFDTLRDAGLLFGGALGGTAYRSAREVRPEGWSTLPSLGPPPRGGEGTAVLFDGARLRTLVFGGGGPQNPAGDLFQLGPNQWAELTPSDPEGDGAPRARAFHSLTYDPERKVVWLYGGRSAGVVLDDLWQLRGAGNVPARVFEFSTSAAGDLRGVRFRRLEWRAHIGGRGTGLDGRAAPGARVTPWLEGTWQSPTPTDAGTSTQVLTAFAWTEADEGALERLLRPLDTVTFAVTPVGTEGPTPARVACTAVELELHYRLPPPDGGI